MQLYPGINTVTVLDALTPKTDYGVWPGPQEALGGDLRSAANLMTMGETLTDRTNFVGWRLPNWIDGGTQQVFGTVIMNGNGGSTSVEWIGVPTLYGAMPITYLTSVTATDEATWTHSGPHTISADTWRFQIGTTVIGDAGSTWIVNGTFSHPSGVNINGDGALTSCDLNINTGARIKVDDQSRFLLSGSIVRAGTKAIDTGRTVLTDFGTLAYTLTDAETFIVPDPSVGTSYTAAFSAPVGLVGGVYRFTVRQAVHSTNYTTTQFAAFTQASGNALFTFQPGLVTKNYPASVLCEYDTVSGVISLVSVFDKNSVVTLP